MPEEESAPKGVADVAGSTPNSSGKEEDLLRLSVKELKNRITQAGGSVPAGHLEKSDLVAALQDTLRDGPKRAAAKSGATDATPVAAATSAQPSVQTSTSSPETGATNGGDVDGSAKEDLSKLSVGEIKRRLRWAGAPVPAGHLEKAELVSALRVALEAKAVADRSQAQKAKVTSAVPPRSSTASTAPRQAAGLSTSTEKDSAAIKEQKDTTKWFVMPEEDLKCLIVDAGGKAPDGNVGRHYLVALLKKALKAKAEADAKPAEPPAAVQSAARAAEIAAKMAAPQEPLIAPAEPLIAEADVPPAATAPKQPVPSTPAEWDPEEDISKLSAGELKRRIREYDEALLVGLAEKSELTAALKKAIQEGPPPNRVSVSTAAVPPAPTGPPSAAAPVELDDAAMLAQMEEMQNLLAAAEVGTETPLEAAACAGEAALDAAKMSESSGSRLIPADSAASSPSIQVTSEKPKPSQLAAPPPASAPASKGKKAKRRCEVTISDDEGEPKKRRVRAARASPTMTVVDAVDAKASAVAIDDDEDGVQAIDTRTSSAAAAKPAKAAQAASEPEGTDEGTWI